ncbi:fumarylacetoacetate hydrolase family protein [Streptomyces adonidis]|uniref:fumarylacetoacetate hydrolase family protein n=1 Tax=Streptomyces adonidis TaxID=3231367 RepID=UPI0034DAF028
MTFSVMTLRMNGRPAPALCVGERYWALADVAPEVLEPDPSRGLMNVFDHWERTEPLLVRTAESLADGTDNTPALPAPATLDDILTPLLYPRKVILTGGNYLDHMQHEAGIATWDKEANYPVFFLKPPTTALVGSGKSVRFPVQSDKFDFEIELAVVIGRTGRRLTLENAMEHVAGYTVLMDLTARDWQPHPKHAVQFDLFAGKVFDDSCPLGPGIVPARFVDPENLRMRFWSNGDLQLDFHTRDMIWSVAEQLVKITEHVTVEPGDVISTGCPSRLKSAWGRYLSPGDVLEGEITGLGRLTVEVVKDRSKNPCPAPHTGSSTMTDPHTILKLDQARRDAMIRADIPTLTAILADDMMCIHGNARVDTKESLLGDIGSGKRKYLAIDCADETVCFHGGLAFLGGVATITAETAGHLLQGVQNRYTIVWAPEGDDWKVVNWQSTSIPKAA